MFLIRILFIVATGGFIACNSGSGQTEQTAEEAQATDPSGQIQSVRSANQGTGQPAQLAPPGPEYSGLASIKIEDMHELYYSCNSLDMIFYNTNFSLSQTDTNQIRTTLEYLLPSPVQHNPACKPRGRATFWVDGELSHEADIYLGENCNYFVWVDGTKPIHINPMNHRGIDFFTKVLTQGHELFKQQGQ